MNFFFRNIILINIFILSLFKYAYSDELNIVKALSNCADYNYSILDFSKLDQKTFEDNQSFLELSKELNLLIKEKNRLTEIYKKEREKYKSKNPEPKMERYTKKEWEIKTSWDKKKNILLAPFRGDLDKIIIEIGKFNQKIYKEIDKTILNYLKNNSVQFKIRNVKGYSAKFQKCEGNYILYPLSFMFQWSENP